MEKITKGTVFDIDELKKHFRDISFLDNHFYTYNGINENKKHEWIIDDKRVELDEFDELLGFPYYLRQIFRIINKTSKKS